MAVLKQLFGTTPFPVYPLEATTTTIGRHQDCDISVDFPDVSRQHARILRIDSRYYVEDLGSRNGSHLNGQAIADRVVLRDGDQIEVSNRAFTFHVNGSETDLSGSGITGPQRIEVPVSEGDTGDSVRRQSVRRGERITPTELNNHGLREDQIISRLQVTDGAGSWPVANNATTKLNHALRMLHALRRFADHQDVLDRIQTTLLELFSTAQRLAIVLQTPEDDSVQVVAVQARQSVEDVQICLPVIQAAMQNTEAILYTDHWRERDSGRVELANSKLPTILAAPLVNRDGSPLGAVQLDTTDTDRPLNSHDLELLLIINQVIAFALDQVDLLDRSLEEAAIQRITADARMLTKYFAVDNAPLVEGFRIGQQLLKTADVAADQIDFVQLTDGRTACLLTDVPGRGSDAARLMAVLNRSLLGGLLATSTAAGALNRAADDFLERLPNSTLIVSAAVLIFDSQQSTVTIAVAGHCPIIVVRNGLGESLQAGGFIGPPFGMHDQAYAETEVRLSPQDAFVAFTDGITRLTSPTGRLLAQTQLCKMVKDAVSADCATETRLRELLDEFRQSAQLIDDVGFVTVSRSHTTETMDDAVDTSREANRQNS